MKCNTLVHSATLEEDLFLKKKAGENKRDKTRKHLEMATFNACFCADVGGGKRNFELAFPKKPDDLLYMVEQVEYVFRKECLDHTSYRSFAIDFMVFFEEQTRRWKPLEGCNQLQEQMQLYIFQTNLAKEQVSEIPVPTKLIHVPTIPGRSRTGGRSVHNPGFSAVDLDKVQAVFEELDINQDGSLSIGELTHAFTTAGVDFSDEATEKLFEKCDVNGDGVIGWDEFRIFADLFPNTTETLYWRLCKTPSDSNPRGSDTNEELKRIRQRQNKIRKEMEELKRAAELVEQRVRQERSIAREADPRRRFLEAEEQDLINKEFALQFHRDMVVQAEHQFSETAVRFDHAAVNQGSPRRARQIAN